MVIYDYSNRVEINIAVMFFCGSLTIIALMLFFLSKDYYNKEDWVTRLFCISSEEIFVTNNQFIRSREELFVSKKFQQGGGVFILLVVLFVSVPGITKYIYSKKINWFEDILAISGRIDNVQTWKFMSTNLVTLQIDGLTFFIAKDKPYISQRNLMQNDSVRIDYFKKQSSVGKIENLTVVKIELKE